MSIARRLMQRQAAPAGAEQRYLGSTAAIPGPTEWAAGEMAFSGPVGDGQAARNMTVFGCVRLLADTIATVPWSVHREDAMGFPVPVRPTPKLIERPCPGLPAWEWKWMNMWSLAMRGNAYNFVLSRDRLGWPTALLPLHPDVVSVEVPNPGNVTRRVGEPDWIDPVYRVAGEVIDPSNMVHIKRYPTPGAAQALSPIRQAAAAIGFAIAAEDYGSKFFKDSAMPSGVLSSDVPNLPDSVIEHAQKEWIRTHGGRRLPAVLSGGFKWQAVSITPEESQFLETRGFQDQQIMRMYGIPPHMMGDAKGATSWGTGIEQLGIGWTTYTVSPWVACFEETMSDAIPRGQKVEFNLDRLQRGDSKARWESHRIARDVGAKSADDIRAEEGMPPIPKAPKNPTPGQVYLQPSNMVPLGTGSSEEEKAAALKAKTAPPPPPPNTGNQDDDVDNGGDANDEEATGNDDGNA